MLKPQDIVILLKILSKMAQPPGEHDVLSQNKLAALLCMSPSEINAGIKRLVFSGLLGPTLRNDVRNQIVFLPIKDACIECLSAIKYFFPVQLGAYTRGIPTAFAAPLFKKLIVSGQDPIPVWPHADGDKRGLCLEPLYRSVPSSLIQHPDKLFYDLLVLVDTIRIGKVREKNIALKLLREMLHAKK